MMEKTKILASLAVVMLSLVFFKHRSYTGAHAALGAIWANFGTSMAHLRPT